jgi:hypothetical protein
MPNGYEFNKIQLFFSRLFKDLQAEKNGEYLLKLQNKAGSLRNYFIIFFAITAVLIIITTLTGLSISIKS